MSNFPPEILAVYLAVTFLFLLFSLRAIYFLINKSDPINSLTLPDPWLKALSKKKEKDLTILS